MRNYAKMTAREIRDLMPDVGALDVLMIPGAIRRELYRAMQTHNFSGMKHCLAALETNAARLTRDQYFQLSHVLNFPIHDWLRRTANVTAAGRQERTASALDANTKARKAIRKLESLGYAWHGPSDDFVEVKPVTTDWG